MSESPDKTKEKEIQKRQEKVSYLLVQGLTETEIAKRLEVPRETIVSDVKDLKSLAESWADEFAKDGFHFEYKLAMDKIKENGRGYRKMLERENLTVSEEIRIHKAIDENTALQVQLLGEGSALTSLNRIVANYGGSVPKNNPS